MTIEETQNPLVFVDCKTFNHATYIEDAMKGFVMQQTEFPFVVSVMDDASTDGEPEVIKRFLEKEFDMDSAITHETDDRIRVVAKHKTNKNCIFLVFYLKYNHYSIQKPKWKYFWNWRKNAKYIAMCEGDDYWTDPFKLQRQVDLLDANCNAAFCFHNAICQDVSGNLSCFNGILDKHVFELEDVVERDWFIPTASILYRLDVSFNNRTGVYFYNGDYQLQIELLRTGLKAIYMPCFLSVYRTGVGVSAKVSIIQNNKFLIDLLEHEKKLSDSKYCNAFDKKIERLKNENVEMEQLMILRKREERYGSSLLYRSFLFVYRLLGRIIFRCPKVHVSKMYSK